jgi:hypothetical protein
MQSANTTNHADVGIIRQQCRCPEVLAHSRSRNYNPLRRVFIPWRKYDLHNRHNCISGNTLTGTGTNFTAAGSLIRNGCTVIALTSPAQVFQITAIGGATSLTVTPAASPAIPAGTKYSILLSDSLSVDGLAQDIAETFTMYQRYMSGFADVMNGTTDVTITINGVAVTVPGQKSLAKKGANSDITSLSGLTTALSIGQVALVRKPPQTLAQTLV